jgi:hypothetical protein
VALLWDVLLTPLVVPGVMRLLARLEPAGARWGRSPPVTRARNGRGCD